MGHQIEYRFTSGDCRLTQCSCGRSALEMKGRTFLLSAREVEALAGIFAARRQEREESRKALVEQMGRLTGGPDWERFTPPA